MPTRPANEIVRELFLDPEGRRSPYPLYHELRAAAPVHRNEFGAWMLSRFDDCRAALRDPRFGKDYPRQTEARFGPKWREHPSLARGEHSMLNVDGPEHTRLRKLVVKGFTRRRVDALRETMERTVESLLDGYEKQGGGDLLESVAFPLPVTVIGEMLGIPAADRPQFRKLVRDLVGTLEQRPTPEMIAAADAAQLAIRAYFLDLIAAKRRQPDEGLLSLLVQGDAQDRLDDDELVTMTTLLFAAGFETTTNLIGNGMLALLRHPDQLAALRADPALFAKLPDELLRYDGTVQMAARVTTAPALVCGVEIPAGVPVIVMLAAGNRDPARNPDPDRFDLRREDVDPLSFGGGVHFCLGASLARLEVDVVSRALLARFGTIELAREPRFMDRLTLRGLEALDLVCRAEASPASRATASRRVPVAARPAAAAPLDLDAAVLGLRPTEDGAWREALRARAERGEVVRPDHGETARLLARTAVLNLCNPAELDELAATAYPLSFEPGDALCVEGAASSEVYAIAEGEALVTIAGKGAGKVGEGDVVGERGPLENRARSATVTAVTHMLTWAISRERFLGVVGRNPALADRMRDEIAKRYEK
jgi:cytochrome P450